jgi:glycine/D-amino acid oxidase-like deaminating enzyme
VLLAAGPWTLRLARMVGASLPRTAERHVVAALGGALVRRLPDLDAAQPRGGWASFYDVSPTGSR